MVGEHDVAALTIPPFLFDDVRERREADGTQPVTAGSHPFITTMHQLRLERDGLDCLHPLRGVSDSRPFSAT